MSALIYGLKSDAFLPYLKAIRLIPSAEIRLLKSNENKLKEKYLAFCIAHLPKEGMEPIHMATLVIIYKNLIDSGVDMGDIDLYIGQYPRKNYLKALLKSALKGYEMPKHSELAECTATHIPVATPPKLALPRVHKSVLLSTKVSSTALKIVPKPLSNPSSAILPTL